MKYFTNGSVNDPSLSGLTVAAFQTDANGNVPDTVNTGYLAQEISEAEYLVWVGRIQNPDNVNYFHGAFGGMGVVDAATHLLIQAEVDIALKASAVVKRSQALIALQRRGITKADIWALIGTLPSPQQEEVSIWFEDSTTFVRSHPAIAMIGGALGLSAAELNGLFAEAALIS